jgi:YaaC-like Protein
MLDHVDWNRITFLESSANIKIALRAQTGKTPSTSLAREAGICLQQGRLFFQSAAVSAMEIRPMLLFYGTMAFAKAIVMCSRFQRFATLSQSHGVKDVSAALARLAELTVRVDGTGTFQQFNDSVASLNQVKYYGNQEMPGFLKMPSAPSSRVAGLVITLKNILARIPALGELYSRTFRTSALAEPILLNPSVFDATFWTAQVWDQDVFEDRAGLRLIVQKWRQRFPVLERWRVVDAQPAWGKTAIRFGNVAVPANELDEADLPVTGTLFSASDSPERNSQCPRLPIEELTQPSGSFTSTHLVAPLNGIYLSECSTHYLGMFLLSSLVRYRPQAWVHAISRTATIDNPADDQALALLEDFMRLHAHVMPQLASTVINPHD